MAARFDVFSRVREPPSSVGKGEGIYAVLSQEATRPRPRPSLAPRLAREEAAADHSQDDLEVFAETKDLTLSAYPPAASSSAHLAQSRVSPVLATGSPAEHISVVHSLGLSPEGCRLVQRIRQALRTAKAADPARFGRRAGTKNLMEAMERYGDVSKKELCRMHKSVLKLHSPSDTFAVFTADIVTPDRKMVGRAPGTPPADRGELEGMICRWIKQTVDPSKFDQLLHELKHKGARCEKELSQIFESPPEEKILETLQRVVDELRVRNGWPDGPTRQQKRKMQRQEFLAERERKERRLREMEDPSLLSEARKRFRCNFCGEYFKKWKACEEHVKSSHPEDVSDGELDMEDFRTSAKKEQHEPEAGPAHLREKEKRFQCIFCEEYFKQWRLCDEHVKNNHAEDIIEENMLHIEVYRTAPNQGKHLPEDHESSLRDNFLCWYCSSTFVRWIDCKSHLASDHSDESCPPFSPAEYWISSIDSDPQLKWK
eukprot:TRINITY_DN19257_c0_g1_i2.p1 TRINITY_DN19257_c0_g1~~TRINITY_DN19257_c0_g1_i2.p1  ORF type:complete len:498 (+),score=80.46 TRINITY_DN19257_c0_g1_i2:38-1495(+)